MQTLIDFSDPQAAGSDSTALHCAFANPSRILTAHSLDQIRPLLTTVQTLAEQGHWCVGYVRYEAAPAFDTALAVHAPDGPLAWFAVYDAPLPLPTATASTSTSVQWRSSLARSVFDKNIEHIHQAIANGELYQVNYTAPLLGQFQGDAPALFAALHQAQPHGYSAFIDTGDKQILSVSPELFFDWQPSSGHILTRPMKGTAPRGANAKEDAQLAEHLQTSAKERAENVMVVDLIRNDLSRIALPFSVQTPRLFHVQTLPTVLQMSSDVQATTRPGTTLADVFTALFPCGSITGAPKVQAMRMIKELEPQARGVYCGAIGVVRPGGHATFNVAIRTLTLRGAVARCGIGSGITADASSDGEWQEWHHKRAFLERASAPFELLETLGLHDGQLPHAGAHLDRMARAAAHFFYPFDRSLLEQRLQALAQQHPTSSWRVRLCLGSQGQVQAQAYPLEATPTPVRLQLATSAFEWADSEFARFKTTHRAHYDAFVPRESGVFDTLLYNRHGEITECTRGNIALRLNGRWVTPPLRCGLLAGVGRGRYLREEKMTEQVVHVHDLPQVQELAFINSLRGWLGAILL